MKQHSKPFPPVPTQGHPQLVRPAEAERRAYEIWGEANYRAQAGLTADVMPFSKMAEEFVALVTEQSERGEHGPSHIHDWPPIIRRYLVGYFGDRPADQIVDADIKRYLEWRRQYWITGPGKDIPYLHYERNGIRLRRRPSRNIPSISRQHGELVVVRALFEQVVKWRYLRPVTVPTIRARKRIDNRRPSFEPHEYKKLIETSLSRRVDPTMLTAPAPVVWESTYVITTELLPAGYPLHVTMLSDSKGQSCATCA